ncbi:N-acetylglucosamine-6-phosphate deacetylase [Lachnobacterium bovis]|uniref:N-acetylglucosamine-6-phosphate deacetylase n=1 Tax=Lachnobacterium bovis TaxID=140626 RepID=UPI00054F10BE|nr:N-acetylglucosamine-6-phosphate deacetylase [Lachnobacterium bovis]
MGKVIKNGIIFGSDGIFAERNIYINDHNKIFKLTHPLVADSDSLFSDAEVIDAQSQYVIPGLCDIHIHGAKGHDFCDADTNGLTEIAEYLHKNGVTSFCPSTCTLPEDRLAEIMKSLNGVPDDSSHSRIVGVNMEGPFINKDEKGCHDEEFIQAPNIALFNKLNALSGNRIKLINVAPEMKGAAKFIETLHSKVNISLGHSHANYNQATTAFIAGANHVTHVFNGMYTFHHRDPGIVGAACDDPKVMIEIICDGVHVHPSVVRMIFAMFGDDRVILVSDSTSGTGMPDGQYHFNNQVTTKKGKHSTLKDGTIAGSVTNLFSCMKNAISYGIPIESAIKAATINPAKSIGMGDLIGTIKPGAEADLLILDKQFNIVRIL